MKKMRISLIVILVIAVAIGFVWLTGRGADPVSAAGRPAASTAAVNRAATATAVAANRAASASAAASTRPTAAASRPAGALAAELKQLQSAVAKLRETIRDNRLRIERLALENRSLRNELQQKLQEVRKTLPASTLEQLKAKRLEIKALAEKLAETRGDIREITATFPALREQRDWAGLRTACERIIAIQNARRDQLQQINTLLKGMLKLIK